MSIILSPAAVVIGAIRVKHPAENKVTSKFFTIDLTNNFLQLPDSFFFLE